MKKSINFYLKKIYRDHKNRTQIFLEIPKKKRIAIFLRLSKHLKYQILHNLEEEQIILLLEALDPDDATDILRLFDKRRQEQLIKKLSENIQTQVSLLLKFDKETAGGLMTLDYIQVDIEDTIAETAKKFKIHEKRTGKPPEIITLKQGKIVGYLPGYELGFAKSSEKVEKYVKNIKKIYYGASSKKVIEKFRNHAHKKMVVLGDNSNIIGIIYADDVLRLLKEQESASLYDFAGVKGEEEVTDGAKLKIKFRYKWLIVNLFTAFLAAFTVGLFEETLNKYVLLAVYMPIVAGMGGNAATQTLAVMVRGIALKQISFKNFVKPLMGEIVAGLVNGIINGVLVFVIVMLVNQDPMIALILAIAMIMNLIVAAFFGTIVPLLMHSLGKDPASSATIFITTATDVLGFLVFLGLATWLLV